MLLIALLAGFFLLFIALGFLVIKLWGLAKGVKKIADFIGFFRQETHYDKVNTSNTQAYNTECPICTNTPSASVSSNCNHAFCSILHLTQANASYRSMFTKGKRSSIAQFVANLSIFCSETSSLRPNWKNN
jgi:hypothetical protein